MKEIKCPRCGKEISDSAEKCPECGYSFEQAEVEVLEQNDSTKEEPMNNSAPEESAGDSMMEEVSDYQHKEKIDIGDNTGKKFSKNIILNVVCIAIAVICFIYSINMNGKYEKVSEEKAELSARLEKEKENTSGLAEEKKALEEKISNLELENDELANGAAKQLSDIKNAYEKSDWQKVIELAATLHEKYNGSQEDIEAQELAKVSQENIDKAKAEEEAEKAKGYETGITYDQLARTPDDFEGKKVKFYGKVLQVIEGDDSVQIRLAVDDNYDTVLFGEYLSSTVSSRVLEDDYITIYGTSVGTISYKSTMGGQITIPGVYIERIDQ